MKGAMNSLNLKLLTRNRLYLLTCTTLNEQIRDSTLDIIGLAAYPREVFCPEGFPSRSEQMGRLAFT